VHFAAGRGICLVPEAGLLNSTFYAVLFDAGFRPGARIELAGIPSRARVSPDGRYAAATVFVYGHSYADADFSTQTTIMDIAAGTTIGELEQYTVFRDGAALRSPDFNFWGVTFAQDSNAFYATLRTAGQIYLVAGDVAARTLRVVGEGVECPSLSPDNTRLAFKKRSADIDLSWRLHVLDLETFETMPLAEVESVDDQVEWLDDDTIVYAKGGDLWTVPSDGGGTPGLLLRDALSPAVVR
jgi:hypothetical protein